METLRATVDLTLSRATKETIILMLTNLRPRDRYSEASRSAPDGEHELSVEEARTLASRLKAVSTAKSDTVIDLGGIELTTVNGGTTRGRRNPNTAKMCFVGYSPMRFLLSADDAEALGDLLTLLIKQWPPRGETFIQLDLDIDYEKSELWGHERDQAVLDSVCFKE